MIKGASAGVWWGASISPEAVKPNLAKAASAALWEDGVLRGEAYQNTGHTHSATSLPMAEQLLAGCGWSLSEVDGFAVTAGPGSFTGLRIGLASVKGMAFALDKPCVPLSTLEGLAYNLSGWPGLICPVMDARVGQVYTALFRWDGGAMHRLMEDAAIREGTPQKLEHNDIRWITVNEIDQYSFCPADEEILRRLKDAGKNLS